MNKENDVNFGKTIFSWVVPEFEKHKREKSWYIWAGVIALVLFAYSIYAKNFYFSVIILITALILILNDGQNPLKVKVVLTEEGIIVGKKFYDYDEMKNFYIIYKPRLDVKNLYIEFKKVFHHRLTIPIIDINPLELRDELLKYLPENLEKINEPLSEGIAKKLKL